jgi:hypothetical protein
MQHGDMIIQHGQATRTSSKEMQQVHVTWTQHGHAAWRYEHAAQTWACCTDMDMQHGQGHAA